MLKIPPRLIGERPLNMPVQDGGYRRIIFIQTKSRNITGVPRFLNQLPLKTKAIKTKSQEQIYPVKFEDYSTGT